MSVYVCILKQAVFLPGKIIVQYLSIRDASAFSSTETKPAALLKSFLKIFLNLLILERKREGRRGREREREQEKHRFVVPHIYAFIG